MIRTLFGLSILALAACDADGSLLQPVSPVLDAEAVAKATTDRQAIMLALHQDATLAEALNADPKAGEITLVQGNTESWYVTTLAGFNFVDDQCSLYFSGLFKLERNSRATVSAFNAFSQTLNAVLAATGAGVVTLTAVAQAFGLATNITDVVANTYLYKLPPAATREFVSTTMAAYRAAVAKEADKINNPAIAYSYIRGYLDLCLPVTIEGMLVDTISSTTATPGDASGGRVEIGLSSRAGSLPALEQPKDTTAPLTKAIPITLSAAEQTLSPSEIRELQIFLCFTGNAVDSDIGPRTRQAMADFFDGLGDPNPEIATGGINQTEIDRVLGAIDKNNDGSVKTCTERGLKTAREVGLRG